MADFMADFFDEELKRVEREISALYSKASEELANELNKLTESVQKEMFANMKKVRLEEMTIEEYQLWVQRKILQTDLYKAKIETMTDILVRTDVASMAVINGYLPSVVAQSYNFTASLGWAGADKAGLSIGTFQVYNARSVQKLIRDNPRLLKVVNVPEDKRWNQQKINREITTGLLKGDSIPKVADRLERVTTMDRNSAIRNARTAMTGAENMGRAEAVDDLEEKGIPIQAVWSATHDVRTRETHILLDGTVRDRNGYFGEGIIDTPLRYPADPDGDPEEIYNCRCRLNIEVVGIDHSRDRELYEQFMQEHDMASWEALKGGIKEKEDAFQQKKELAIEKRRKEGKNG